VVESTVVGDDWRASVFVLVRFLVGKALFRGGDGIRRMPATFCDARAAGLVVPVIECQDREVRDWQNNREQNDGRKDHPPFPIVLPSIVLPGVRVA
jgi:hypothetical protein